ncbi:MAG: GtrA family protein [Roseovarius sp.]|jgi:putative flippase GtrA|uniref:GtrA family protein n=1 Tax=Roseovarius sp. TaxID=1486281 RepID=UPI0032ED04F4
MAVSREFSRYFAVGALGFAVDAGVIYALVLAGGDPYLMRLGSFALAVSVTWWCNRRWTFRRADQTGAGHQYLTYFGVQTVGAGVNYAVFAAVLSVTGSSAGEAVLASACGSAVALGLNFAGARLVVFRSHAA